MVSGASSNYLESNCFEENANDLYAPSIAFRSLFPSNTWANKRYFKRNETYANPTAKQFTIVRETFTRWIFIDLSDAARTSVRVYAKPQLAMTAQSARFNFRLNMTSRHEISIKKIVLQFTEIRTRFSERSMWRFMTMWSMPVAT